jgi:catechol 2,3-dioxygenase-like lactoylglutathione lyase family enzyme
MAFFTRRRTIATGAAAFTALAAAVNVATDQSFAQQLVEQGQSTSNSTGKLQANSEQGLETLQIFNVAISVANLDESIKWYQDKLGFRLQNRRRVSTGIEIALIEKNGFFIDLIYIAGSENMEGNPQDPPDHLKVQGLRNLVFWVDDLQAANAQLKAKGVQLIWESRYIPEVKTSVTNFRDNNGNLIALWER